MKLKLVVASMSILGLVSAPVFASTQARRSHHKVMKHRTKRHRDYKDMGNFPVKVMKDGCTMGQAAMTMEEMTQSVGRSMPNPCNAGWFNRVQFSGGMNMDLGKWGNRNGNYMGENYQRLSLNDAYLNVGATVNDWVKAFASLSYHTATANAVTAPAVLPVTAEYSAAYSNNATGATAASSIELEQAYVTMGNLDHYPVFVQLGKGFQDFGRYMIHPITRSMPQVMSETLATAAKVGFIANGFHGSASVFDNPVNKTGLTRTSANYVAALGYNQDSHDLGYDVGVSWIHNMMGVNDIAYMVNQYTAAGWTSRKAGWAFHGDVNSGPFSLAARYVAALSRFNVVDLAKNAAATQGAKPWSADVNANYAFDAMGYNQNVYVGYQTSRQAAALLLPRTRWSAGYNVDVYKNTNLGVEWNRDIAYNTTDGGTGNNTNLVTLRAAVKFG